MKDTMIIYYDAYRTNHNLIPLEEARMRKDGEAAGYNVVIIRTPNRGSRVEIIKAEKEPENK